MPGSVPPTVRLFASYVPETFTSCVHSDLTLLDDPNDLPAKFARKASAGNIETKVDAISRKGALHILRARVELRGMGVHSVRDSSQLTDPAALLLPSRNAWSHVGLSVQAAQSVTCHWGRVPRRGG
jgi:hypothetical protein